MAFGLLLSPDHIRNFWKKVAKGGPDECWLWTGWKNASGHARFEVAGQKMLATHVSLILTGQPRPAPPNHFALHGDTCVSASCVNPNHLRWGSPKDNTDDRDRLGRRTPKRGEAHGNSRLTEEQVRYIRQSPLNQYEMAAKIGVSQVTIGHVRNRKTWTHIP